MKPTKWLTPATVSLIAFGATLIVSQAHGAPAPDPCSLLTSDQVAAALGMSVGAGNALAPTVCMWGRLPKRVTVTLHQPQEFAALKMPIGNGTTKVAVGGVGDDAVSGTSQLATTLAVKKGAVVFVVQVNGFPEDQVKAMENALALEVVAKL